MGQTSTKNMETNTQLPPISKGILWVGYIVSALPVLLLIFSAVIKLMKPPQVVENFARFGFTESLIFPLGLLELACTMVYLIPRTSILGAVLITGYLGGATATNVRLGEPFLIPVIAGVLVWGGLYLRDRRVRALLPLRS
jgi:DoxX-like family